MGLGTCLFKMSFNGRKNCKTIFWNFYIRPCEACSFEAHFFNFGGVLSQFGYPVQEPNAGFRDGYLVCNPQDHPDSLIIITGIC